MSRTDKTKPYWVRVAEHDPVEVHDHSRGVCDLPVSAYEADAQYWRRGCRWEAPDSRSTCCLGCACALCSGRGVLQRRRERHRAAQALDAASWYDEAYPERWPNTRRYKDTARWCRGKAGREHVVEVRYGKWASWRLGNGRTPCAWTTWGDPHWQCYHEVGCTVCGKIVEHFLSQDRCPTWIEKRPPRPEGVPLRRRR